MFNKISMMAFAAILFFASQLSYGQTTAMDFNRKDCNGNMQSLFADLDAGNAVIIEFFMQSCGSCVNAGKKLEPMKAALLNEFPGKIKSYAIGYSNSYNCTSNATWVSTNGFTSIPMDSGAAQVAYYGGMGMPTIVVLGGGTAHKVLGTPYKGFSTSDTTKMASDIRTFLNGTTGVKDFSSSVSGFKIYPNPANNNFNLSLELKETSNVVIDVLDVTGKQIVTVLNDNMVAGNYTNEVNTANFPSGLYFVRVNANGNIAQYKLNIVH